MVNLLLTDSCNLRCTYCFAKEKMGTAAERFIAPDQVQTVIDFLKRSGVAQVGLIGGEPTLHPQFKSIAEMLLTNGLSMVLFSNGLWKNPLLNEFFKRIAPTRLNIRLNINAPFAYSEKQWKRLNENLWALRGAKNVALGMNIYDPAFLYTHMLELITAYNIEHRLRWSLTYPIVGKENIHVKFEDYRQYVPRLMEFAQYAGAHGISIHSDCGVPQCLFSPEERVILDQNQCTYGHHEFRDCYPIDIGTDLTVWSCFTTSSLFNVALTDFYDLYELKRHFSFQFKRYRDNHYPYEACHSCKYKRRNQCFISCLSYAIASAKQPQAVLTFQTIKPKKREGLSIKKYDFSVYRVLHINGIHIQITPEMEWVLEKCDGNTTLEEIKSEIHSNIWFSDELKRASNSLFYYLFDIGAVE